MSCSRATYECGGEMVAIVVAPPSPLRVFRYDANHRDTSDTYGPSQVAADFGLSWQYDLVGHLTAAIQGADATCC